MLAAIVEGTSRPLKASVEDALESTSRAGRANERRIIAKSCDAETKERSLLKSRREALMVKLEKERQQTKSNQYEEAQNAP